MDRDLIRAFAGSVIVVIPFFRGFNDNGVVLYAVRNGETVCHAAADMANISFRHWILFDRIVDQISVFIVYCKVFNRKLLAGLSRFDILAVYLNSVFHHFNGDFGWSSTVDPQLFESDFPRALFIPNRQQFSINNSFCSVFNSITKWNGFFFNGIDIGIAAAVVNGHFGVGFLPVVPVTEQLPGIKHCSVLLQRECHRTRTSHRLVHLVPFLAHGHSHFIGGGIVGVRNGESVILTSGDIGLIARNAVLCYRVLDRRAAAGLILRNVRKGISQFVRGQHMADNRFPGFFFPQPDGIFSRPFTRITAVIPDLRYIDIDCFLLFFGVQHRETVFHAADDIAGVPRRYRIFRNGIIDRPALIIANRKIAEGEHPFGLFRLDNLLFGFVNGSVFNQINGHLGCSVPVFPYLIEPNVSGFLLVTDGHDHSAGNGLRFVFHRIAVWNGFLHGIGIGFSVAITNRYVGNDLLPAVCFIERSVGPY